MSASASKRLDDGRGSVSPLPNKALHADGARLGETTLVATLGYRPLGAGAAGERQGVRRAATGDRRRWSLDSKRTE